MLNNLSNALSAVFDLLHTPALLINCDEDGVATLSRVNQAAVERLQIDAKQISAQPIEQTFPDAAGFVFRDKLLETLKHNTAKSFKLSVHREHYIQQLNIELRPAQTIDGRVGYILATADDVSNHHAAVAENVKMSHLVNEMESFMAHSAHELEAPIRDLSALSKELQSNFRDLGDGKLQLLDKVEGLSNNTLKLINQVLERSRAINTAVDKPSSYDFKTLCSEVMYLYDPKSRHELVVDSVWVNGESQTMQLAIATLFENAMAHNASQSLKLSVSIEQNQERNMLFVTLLDNGQGFENPNKAFSDKNKISQAPGLCLIELKQIIKNAGGAILATNSESGCGAVISFSLPGSLV